MMPVGRDESKQGMGDQKRIASLNSVFKKPPLPYLVEQPFPACPGEEVRHDGEQALGDAPMPDSA